MASGKVLKAIYNQGEKFLPEKDLGTFTKKVVREFEDDYKPYRKPKISAYHNAVTGEDLGVMNAGQARELAKKAGWKQTNVVGKRIDGGDKPRPSIDGKQRTYSEDEYGHMSDAELLWLIKHRGAMAAATPKTAPVRPPIIRDNLAELPDGKYR